MQHIPWEYTHMQIQSTIYTRQSTLGKTQYTKYNIQLWQYENKQYHVHYTYTIYTYTLNKIWYTIGNRHIYKSTNVLYTIYHIQYTLDTRQYTRSNLQQTIHNYTHLHIYNIQQTLDNRQHTIYATQHKHIHLYKYANEFYTIDNRQSTNYKTQPTTYTSQLTLDNEQRTTCTIQTIINTIHIYKYTRCNTRFTTTIIQTHTHTQFTLTPRNRQYTKYENNPTKHNIQIHSIR